MRYTAILLTVLVFGCDTEVDSPTEVVIASDQGASFSMAANDDAIYWSGERGVRRMSRWDGEIRWVGDGTPSLALAVDDQRIYWAEADRVMWAPIEGGAPREIAAGQRCVFAMAADGRRVFWASVLEGTIWAWDSQTGSRYAIAADQDSPTGIAVEGDRVFWTTGAGRVTSTLKDGTEPRMLVEDQPWLSALAVDGERVYLAAIDGSIRAAARDGGAVERIADGRPLGNFASGLAVDGGDVYWVTGEPESESDGAIRFLERGHSTVDVIARARAMTVVVDDERVYWTTAGGDVVAREKGHSDAY